MGSLLPSQVPQLCSPAAHAATAYPQWMLLAPYGYGGGLGEDCKITGDTKTMAAASTSSGHRIIVSVCREPPSPALSRICLFRPNTEIRMPVTGIRPVEPIRSAYATVVAAHGGSVLVLITSTEHYLKPTAVDYFVYTNAAGAADPARPPSLHLLPPRPSTSSWWGWGLLDSAKLLDVRATGFLCRGEAEFVVAQLKMPPDAANDDDAQAELLLFRNGEWRVERPSVVHSHGSDGDLLLAKWKPQAVVAVGDGVLCWVDFSRGIIFSDVFHQTNVLRYVPYPAEARATELQCFVCTNTRGELKLVSVSPRRCSHCGCSQHATAVDTWTLDTDDRAWVLETGTTSMVDDDDDDDIELWALDETYYARHHLVYPVPVAGMNGGGGRVVSSDDSAAPTRIDENHSLQSSRTLSMPTRVPMVDRVVRRSPRILHKNMEDKREYPHIRLDYGPQKRHRTVQVEELKLGNPSNSTSPIPVASLESSEDAMMAAPSTSAPNDAHEE